MSTRDASGDKPRIPFRQKKPVLGNQESSLYPYITADPGQLRGNSSPANKPFNEENRPAAAGRLYLIVAY
ncbi:hypothetical protein J21TS7_19280 [Paenibacillus cineris]|uniref:Uncharacterized protein n=1 Tax=Paenibacillus cineris TaxID=237530 RepID=A0ABQ4LBF1_9BACL|nr:hypothetical protein J21TS7_19280 [Paenibacillus cineris]